MNAFRKLSIFALIASAVCWANSPGKRLPTLGLYVVDDAGTDLLEVVIPVLHRQRFDDTLSRGISREQLPIAIYRNSRGDEIQIVLGQHCMLLEFNGAAAATGAEDPNVIIGRFTAVHDELQRQFAALPEPRPRIAIAGPVLPGCPTEF